MDIKEIRRVNLATLISKAISQTELAERSDTNPTYLSQILNGTLSGSGTRREVGNKLARKLETGCGLVHGWMDQLHSDAEVSALSGLLPVNQTKISTYHPEDPLPDDHVLIKVSEVHFQGGNGHDLTYELIEDSEPVSYQFSWFQKERLNPNRCKRFKCSGDSNEPFVFSGDSILVNLDETAVKNGKVYAFWHEGEGRRMKKLFLNPDGTLRLKSFNPEYPDEIVPADDVPDKIIIIGRVRDKSGRGGL